MESRRGEVSVINGPSGSGKTTLLQIAGLLMRATRGDVSLLGKSLNGVPESPARHRPPQSASASSSSSSTSLLPDGL
jgi:ABC-type lipoprotein export system ATPase subunit